MPEFEMKKIKTPKFVTDSIIDYEDEQSDDTEEKIKPRKISQFVAR